MENFMQWILEHAGQAHWIMFFGILLAGFNIPISADLLIISAAVLAATVVPENMWLLFGSVFFGCLFSAYIAYWLGRLLGTQLLKLRFFSRLLPQERLLKIQGFYEKYGLLTLIIGRFIPLGVRNAIFMTSGISKVSFGKFVLRDFIACSIWTSVCFFCFYALGHHIETIKKTLHSFQLALIVAFGVTIIGFFWYKKRKKATPESSS